MVRFTTQDLALILDVPRHRVRWMTGRLGLKPVKAGNRSIYTKDDLNAMHNLMVRIRKKSPQKGCRVGYA